MWGADTEGTSAYMSSKQSLVSAIGPRVSDSGDLSRRSPLRRWPALSREEGIGRVRGGSLIRVSPVIKKAPAELPFLGHVHG